MTKKEQKKEMHKKITRDVVLILVVIAGLVSFFYNPQGIEMEFLRTLLGGVVGYYIGIKELPLSLIRK